MAKEANIGAPGAWSIGEGRVREGSMVLWKNPRPYRIFKARQIEEKLQDRGIDKREKLTSLFFTTAFTIFMMSSLYLWQFTKMVQYNRANFQLEGQIKFLEQKNAQLRMEIANLSAISRVKLIATQKLRMIEPTHIEYLQVD